MLNLKTGKHFTYAPTMTRGGFLKGILASGIAPSITLATLANAGSANASVGGMMRNVGARISTLNNEGEDAMYKELWENLMTLVSGGLTTSTDFVENGIETLGIVMFRQTQARSMTFNNLKTIKGGTQDFQNANIKELNFPVLTRIENGQVFQSCSSVKRITMPNLEYMHTNWMFTFCSALQYVNLGKLTSFYNATNTTFHNCSSSPIVDLLEMESSYLLGTQICTVISGSLFTHHSVTFRCKDGNVVFDNDLNAWKRVDRA